MQNNKDQEETPAQDDAMAPAAFTDNSTKVSRMMAAEQIEMKAHVDKLLRELDDGRPSQITRRSCP